METKFSIAHDDSETRQNLIWAKWKQLQKHVPDPSMETLVAFFNKEQLAELVLALFNRFEKSQKNQIFNSPTLIETIEYEEEHV